MLRASGPASHVRDAAVRGSCDRRCGCGCAESGLTMARVFNARRTVARMPTDERPILIGVELWRNSAIIGVELWRDSALPRSAAFCGTWRSRGTTGMQDEGLRFNSFSTRTLDVWFVRLYVFLGRGTARISNSARFARSLKAARAL